MTSPDVVVMGRIGMDIYPEQAGSLSEVTSFSHAVGGSAANVAVACARLGCSASLISAVGDDRVGRYLLGELAQYGVDATHVGVHSTLKTPVVIAELDPPEDPGLEFYRWPSAPDLHIDADHLPRLLIESAQLLWVTGTGLSVEPSRSATCTAMQWRRDLGRDVVFDLDWRPMLWSDPASAHAAYAAALPYATVVVGNRAEIAVALNTTPETSIEWARSAAQHLLDGSARCVIVKLGADGVLLMSEGSEEVIVPPIRIDVVCGLGAGDAFGGSLCHSLVHEHSLHQTGAQANAAGALVAARLLCAEAMPTLAELTEFQMAHRADGGDA